MGEIVRVLIIIDNTGIKKRILPPKVSIVQNIKMPVLATFVDVNTAKIEKKGIACDADSTLHQIVEMTIPMQN